MEDALIEIEGLSADQFIKLGESGLKTRDDLADLAADELIEMLGEDGSITEDHANTVIMAARAHWFAEEDAAAAEAEAASDTEGEAPAETDGDAPAVAAQG